MYKFTVPEERKREIVLLQDKVAKVRCRLTEYYRAPYLEVNKYKAALTKGREYEVIADGNDGCDPTLTVVNDFGTCMVYPSYIFEVVEWVEGEEIPKGMEGDIGYPKEVADAR